ncbi:MAG: SPFH/Band 7/PHB domain protein [Gammaproteobacteria bacterium]|nr:SPFH/Band 7/PHB domain protein [Gammaproteobacteria bacterium]
MEAGLFVLVVLGLAIGLLFMGAKMVPQGSEWTVERFGQFTRSLTPGLHWIIPVVDSVGNKVNMKEIVSDVPQQEVITKDNAMVQVDGIIFYQVLDAAKATYEVARLEVALINIAMTNIRAVVGSMELDETLSNRDQINAKIQDVVGDAAAPWGVKVNRVELKEITPPRDIVEAMQLQLTSERQKRAEILKAEGDRQAEIVRAEGSKQAAILEAEGRQMAAIKDAEARERLAEAEAKATMMVSRAVQDGDPQALNYFVAQKYVESLLEIGKSENSKLVLMPLDASGVVGSIGGITELVKNLKS